MYELVQVGPSSYYMDCPTKVGFYQIGEDQVVLIDSGSDKDAARKVKKILDAQGWKLVSIFNTHSHADHIGGNQYLQQRVLIGSTVNSYLSYLKDEGKIQFDFQDYKMYWSQV